MGKKEVDPPVSWQVDMQLWQYGQGAVDVVNAHIKMISKSPGMDWPAVQTTTELMLYRLIKARRAKILEHFKEQTSFDLIPTWDAKLEGFEMVKKV